MEQGKEKYTLEGHWPITTHNGDEVHSAPDRHHVAGRLGGLQTYMRYGTVHMIQIGHKGGRPTRQEAAHRAWERIKVAKKHAGRTRHQRR